jgi:hypothetical protein
MSIDKTRLEIGHVLFIDIAGYSKLLVKQRSELLRELNEIVSGTSEFQHGFSPSATRARSAATGSCSASAQRNQLSATSEIEAGSLARIESIISCKATN